MNNHILQGFQMDLRRLLRGLILICLIITIQDQGRIKLNVILKMLSRKIYRKVRKKKIESKLFHFLIILVIKLFIKSKE